MTVSAPIRRLRETHVTMAHGGGGKAMRSLIDTVFAAAFEPDGTEDQARLMTAALAEPGARLAFTTDSFVVTPIEFPGGDIGKLAVCGTVNDLAVGGAVPLWLSAAFIIEEGCEIALLTRIAATMRASALSRATSGSASSPAAAPSGTRSRSVAVRTPSSPRLGSTSET